MDDFVETGEGEGCVHWWCELEAGTPFFEIPDWWPSTALVYLIVLLDVQMVGILVVWNKVLWDVVLVLLFVGEVIEGTWSAWMPVTFSSCCRALEKRSENTWTFCTWIDMRRIKVYLIKIRFGSWIFFPNLCHSDSLYVSYTILTRQVTHITSFFLAAEKLGSSRVKRYLGECEIFGACIFLSVSSRCEFEILSICAVPSSHHCDYLIPRFLVLAITHLGTTQSTIPSSNPRKRNRWAPKSCVKMVWRFCFFCVEQPH